MSEFTRFLLGLHAQARRIDRDQALLGALGVGAFAYPHQIDSVHRMSTGITCRWLLADEVGLGKTIQAIMVMRALAAQSASCLRVKLVVPDDLVSQWEEELLTRGHALAIDQRDREDIGGTLAIDLVRPSALSKEEKINPAHTDLLLVDEFPRLTAQVRRDLVLASRGIPNVLLMTATPLLHDRSVRRELLTILEPEMSRFAVAEDRDILEVLAEREQTAILRFGSMTQDTAGRRAIEETFGVYRRLIRTQRSDYPDTLPQRDYYPIRLEPTDGDIFREQATRKYLSAARSAGFDIRGHLLLQVAGRSPAALRDRLSSLKRQPADVGDAWRRIDASVRDYPSDSRLDALVDHIRSVHRQQPDRRIVVVAEDNPTTDYLRNALEKLADVKVARKRRQVGISDALEVQIATLKDALDDFISGEAKVLVAADVAREGHNLQFAEEIIFFAMPWSPTAIQQWIGRIDRLGTRGLPSRRRISITPLVVQGSIESRILDVLEETDVFRRSEVYDDAEWEGIADAINDAAYGLAGASWSEASKRARAVGDGYDEWLQSTALPPLPRATLAQERMKAMRQRSYPIPIGVENNGGSYNWLVAREAAAEQMLRLAGTVHFDIRKGRDGEQRFWTIWYRERPKDGDLTFRELDPKSSFYRQTYITRRASICCPPKTHVVQNDGTPRALRFFDHGDSLHDDIVSRLERSAPKSDLGFEHVVDYPDGHPMLEWEGEHLLFAVSELRLADALSFDADTLIQAKNSRLSTAERQAHQDAARRALEQFQADRRWLLDLVPPEFLITAVRSGGLGSISPDATMALFKHIQDDVPCRQRSRRRTTLAQDKLRRARELSIGALQEAARVHLQRAIVVLSKAVQLRLFEAEAEAEILINATEAEIRAKDRLDQKLEFNRAEQRGARLAADLARDLWTCRVQRLQCISDKLSEVVPSGPKILVVVPRRMSVED